MTTLRTLVRDIERTERMLRNPVFESLNSSFLIELCEAERFFQQANEAGEPYRRAAEAAASQAAAQFQRMRPDVVRFMKFANANGLVVRPAHAPPAPTPAPTPATSEVAPETATTAVEASEAFGWTSRYRQALSGPELTAQEQTELLASITFAGIVWLHLMALQYRAVSDEVARIDATIGVGMAVFGVLYALLIKRK